MHGRATPFEQTSRAAKQGAGADGKATVGTRYLPADPREHIFVLHQGFLTEAARHVQHIELWRVSQSCIPCETQTVQIANRLKSLAVEAVGRVGNARQDFKRPLELDLSSPSKRSEPICK
jgi:hypothetical protein